MREALQTAPGGLDDIPAGDSESSLPFRLLLLTPGTSKICAARRTALGLDSFEFVGSPTV
jgi:hypothetical protein